MDNQRFYSFTGYKKNWEEVRKTIKKIKLNIGKNLTKNVMDWYVL